MTVSRIEKLDITAVSQGIISSDMPPQLSLMESIAGESPRAARSDHTHPVRVQRFRAPCGSDGKVKWQFKKAFDAIPVVTYMAENTSDQPIIANLVAAEPTQ